MVGIPAGTFTMGDAKNTSKAGQVTVDAFCMGRTEVTTAAYATCVKSGKCTPAEARSRDYPPFSWYCNAGVAGRGNHPINCVDWDSAKKYCQAQGQRLPTEEEWEYAARGTDGRIYPWGNAEPNPSGAGQLCWNRYRDGKTNSTCAVAAFPRDNSPFGVADMAGNVNEWTSSINGGTHAITASWIISRGGAWIFDDPLIASSAHRGGSESWRRASDQGFRCAGSPLP